MNEQGSNNRLPSQVTVEQVERFMDRMALEIAATEKYGTPSEMDAVMFWWDFLEREMEYVKEGAGKTATKLTVDVGSRRPLDMSQFCADPAIA